MEKPSDKLLNLIEQYEETKNYEIARDLGEMLTDVVYTENELKVHQETDWYQSYLHAVELVKSIEWIENGSDSWHRCPSCSMLAKKNKNGEWSKKYPAVHNIGCILAEFLYPPKPKTSETTL